MSIFTPLPAFPSMTPLDVIDNEFIFDLPVGDTIVSATMSSNMSGMTFPTVVVDGNTVVAWITGGVAGQSAIVTCEIVTTMGRTYYRSATVAVLAVC